MKISNSTIKATSPSVIQYTFITNSRSYSSNYFYCAAFDMLRSLPVDFLQLNDSVTHFDFSFRFIPRVSYELFAFPSFFFNNQVKETHNLFRKYLEQFNVHSKVHVFIIDSQIKNHSKVVEFLAGAKHFYYTVISKQSHPLKEYSSPNFFTSTHELLSYFKRDFKVINNSISKYYENADYAIKLDLKFQINPNKILIDSNTPPGSILAQNNYFMLNQLIGNVWIDGMAKLSETVTKHENRSEELINQCQKLDKVSMIMFKNIGIKRLDPFHPLLPTLILIFPFHFPKREKLYSKKFNKKEKIWISIQKAEQNLNYGHQFTEKEIKRVSQKEFQFIMEQTSLRLRYLDLVGFLHARFTYSPIIRLPQIGKSINKELSHLEKLTPKKSSTISNIKKFGEKLKEHTLSDNLVQYLSERNGQILAISDLPVEWLYLNEHPLSYTHDICRLPEFNLNGLVNSAIHTQRLLYEIPENLINKTLVIHCASSNDQPLNKMFDLIDSYKSSLGFFSVRCTSIGDIKKAIEEYSPDLLIFDCHGSSNSKDLSSFLIVDGENNIYLTGNDIVKHELSAPLVFLSACETMPNYGYVKLLSDAFMEAGAHCVTTTFLPIKIIDAARLIIRILNKLFQLKSNGYHNNWLNFMSHTLRTTLIHEAIREARPKLKDDITDDEIAQILVKTMKFETRNLALKELDELIAERSKSNKLRFSELDNEWLSYSIIGRADLIYFKNWLKAFRKLNDFQEK